MIRKNHQDVLKPTNDVKWRIPDKLYNDMVRTKNGSVNEKKKNKGDCWVERTKGWFPTPLTSSALPSTKV